MLLSKTVGRLSVSASVSVLPYCIYIPKETNKYNKTNIHLKYQKDSCTLAGCLSRKRLLSAAETAGYETPGHWLC